MAVDPLTFITGFVATKLTQKTAEAAWKGTRRAFGANTPVHKALVKAVKTGADAAAAQVYGDSTDEADAVRRALLERDEETLPLVDGTPLTHIVEASRAWAATLAAPVEDDRQPGHAEPEPALVEALSVAILAEIQDEATRGDGVLARLWNDFRHQQTQVGSRTGSAAQADWQEYWNPELPAAEFVGREAELNELDSTPAGSDGVRLVCSVGGIGGVGKTALAVEYANRHADEYPDGRIYYNFHSYSGESKPVSGAQALREILPKVLGDVIPLERLNQLDDHGVEAEWRRATHGRRLIMVWDNISDTEQIGPLLLRQPGCTTIVTSRAALDIPRSRALWLDALEQDEAVALFDAIAGEPQDEVLVARLVNADMYMPVLIESHAKLIRSGRRLLPQVLGEIEGLPREKTWTALDERLAGSYQALDEIEKYLFRVIGAAPGTSMTAGAVAAVLECEVHEAVELCDALHDVGLIEPYRTAEAGARPELYAYTSHDVVSDYAARLAGCDPDEYEETGRRLIAHFEARLDAFSPQMLDWFQLEKRNIWKAAGVVAWNGPRLAGMLGGKLLATSDFRLAEAAFMVAAIHHGREEDPLKMAESFLGIGSALRMLGEFGEAKKFLRDAADMATLLDDAKVLADAHRGLGNVALRDGRYAEAETQLLQAATEYRTLGDDRGLANALRSLGNIAFRQRRFEDAEGYFSQSLELHEAVGDRTGFANALHGLGEVARKRSKYALALERFEQAADEARTSGNRANLASALWAIGGVRADRGEDLRARAALTEAAEIFEMLQMEEEREKVRKSLRRLESPPRRLGTEFRGGNVF